MRFTTKTEYGLVCMVHLARHPEGEWPHPLFRPPEADRLRSNRRKQGMGWITSRELAARENYPVAYTEKILQALRQANLVVSHEGTQGGYGLARRPSEITVKEIIEAMEGSTFDVFCQDGLKQEIVCTHFCLCGVKPIWRRAKQILDEFFDSITLEMLAKGGIEIQSLIGEAAHSHGA